VGALEASTIILVLLIIVALVFCLFFVEYHDSSFVFAFMVATMTHKTPRDL